MAIDKADNEKTTTEEVKEATQEMNYNPNAHLQKSHNIVDKETNAEPKQTRCLSL